MTNKLKPDVDYIIGVDGGGSKTQALLASLDGAILGKGTSGGSNLHSHGMSAAFASLESAIQSAQKAAGLSRSPFAACLGLAGADRPEDIALISDWWRERFPGVKLQIVNDAWLVLAAGTPSGIGVAIISGTGSISVSRAADGKMARSGGWGYLFGDEGSGYAIGLKALQVVSQSADGRAPATLLTELILSHFNLQKPVDLIGKIYNLNSPRAELAQLAMLVRSAADQGDAAALKILTGAGDDLAAVAIASARQVGLHGPTPVAAAGSLLVQWPALQDAFRKSAVQAGLEPVPFTPVAVPALGAINLARQLLNNA